MSISKGVLVGVLALAGVALAAGAAGASPKVAPRRRVTGKTGHVWFTVASKDDANTVKVEVFNSEDGDDQVIAYRQVQGPTAGAVIGDRFLIFQAPTSLLQTAISDFGPFKS